MQLAQEIRGTAQPPMEGTGMSEKQSDIVERLRRRKDTAILA
jgi:hypothetical protein